VKTELLPVYTEAPTEAGLRLLRRVLAGERLTAVAAGCHGVVCLLGGETATKSLVAGLITRGLIEPAGETDATTTYALTERGRAEAQS
jgi:hypothetical protein